MSKSNSTSSQNTAEPISALRDIFTAKGYETGMCYNKNDVQYSVVADGSCSFLILTQGAEARYYGEVGSKIFVTADDLYEYKAELSTEEKKNLRQEVIAIVDREALDLGLTPADARAATDRATTYLRDWKTYTAESRNAPVTDAEVGAEFAQIRNLSITETIGRANSLAINKVLRDGLAPALFNPQWTYINDWLVEEAGKKHIVPMATIVEKYVEIKDLAQQHQIDAFCLGLTAQQADNTSPNQLASLQATLNAVYVREGRRLQPEEMQAQYEIIKDLKLTHQINALALGLNSDQAQAASIHQVAYLAHLNNVSGGEEDLQAEYVKIAALTSAHQLYAVRLGLTIPQAEVISRDQAAYMNEIYNLNNGLSSGQIRAAYAKIESLPHRYQINAQSLGLTLEQAQTVPKHISDFLLELQINSPHERIPATEMQQNYSELQAMPDHQSRALVGGLSYGIATNLTAEEFEEISKRSREYERFPQAGESPRATEKRYLNLAYQAFSLENFCTELGNVSITTSSSDVNPPSIITPATTSSVRLTRVRDEDLDTENEDENDRQSKKSKPNQAGQNNNSNSR